jgi:uncharacterized protein (UPF0332 family)
LTDSEYIGAPWLRANESLKGAEALVPIDPNAAASRAYYAAFHAVSALFGLEGRTFKKHSEVAASVHRDLVHAGRWSRDLGAAFSQLSSQRRIGDYGAVGRVSREEAAICVDLARSILDAVSREHPKALQSSFQG